MAIQGFDPNSYLAANVDLLRAGLTVGDAELHYILYGQKEKRSTAFNAAAYIASYADLRNAFGTDTSAATQQFISSGWKEGRSITFDSAAYLASNPDLLRAGLTVDNAANHYLSFGASESRSTNSFNSTYYLQANRDLYTAGIYTAKAATQHYVNSGWKEGRRLIPAVHETGSGLIGPTSYAANGTTLYKGETYVVNVVSSTPSSTKETDWFLEVGNYDNSSMTEIFPGLFSGTSTFKSIASDDNSGGGLSPRLIFSPPTTGMYQFRVSIKNNVTDAFRMTIDSI